MLLQSDNNLVNVDGYLMRSRRVLHLPTIVT